MQCNGQSLLAPPEQIQTLKTIALACPSFSLSPLQLGDLELLLSRTFSPLVGYLNRADFESTLNTWRLVDGTLWPMPVSLDVPAALATRLSPGKPLALRDPEGFLLAVMTVGDIWESDPAREARALFDVKDIQSHPGALAYAKQTGPYRVGGPVTGVALPPHVDYPELRRTPARIQAAFQQRGWRNVLGVQAPPLLFCRHKAILLQAAKDSGGSILLSRPAGDAIAGGTAHFAGIRCTMHFATGFPPNLMLVNLLPFSVRQAGPRQALFEALIHKNCGCTNTLVAPDHADPQAAVGAPFYSVGAAQRLVADHERETGIRMTPQTSMAYVEEKAQYVPTATIAQGCVVKDIDAAEFNRRLEFDLAIPDWFALPQVVEELRMVFPPRSRQGITLFMTGLSGAGKSTLAKLLYVKFMEMRTRPVTLLDGDIVRRHLSSELTFSKEHRNLNIARIGFVASEITKNGGIAICAPIAPYASARAEARALVSPHGGFVEIHVSTPLSVCETRDRKGLYAKARAGIVKGVTGIDDPYEIPEKPEISLDTSVMTPGEAVQEVLLYLERQGYLA